MADIDRATVGQQLGTVLNLMPCHRKSIQSDSMISQSFDAVVYPLA